LLYFVKRNDLIYKGQLIGKQDTRFQLAKEIQRRRTGDHRQKRAKDNGTFETSIAKALQKNLRLIVCEYWQHRVLPLYLFPVNKCNNDNLYVPIYFYQ
jgi:hypothetical protein